MKNDNNINAFFALVQAGLWEHEVQLAQFDEIDYSEVMRIAEEQSVIGLVAAGIEHVVDVKVPREDVLHFVSKTLQMEQRNIAMNDFVARLIEKLRKEEIYTLLVKGQGIAQCYERPLWRASGDVDLLLSNDNYEKAKKVLIPLASSIETEYTHFKHQGMVINGWEVELHGTQHSRLSRQVDRVVDQAQKDIFYSGKVQSWMNGNTIVFLPAPDSNVIFLFTHILHHFFLEGIGMRQICDWCRFLWTYRLEIDNALLEERLCRMGLMTEWKAFAAYAVEYLGMPVDAMPLFDKNDSHNDNLKRKAEKISRFVLKVGNFGHKQKRDFSNMSYIRRKFLSFWGHLGDILRHFAIFPKDSILFVCGVLRTGLYAAVRGE